MKNYKRRFSFIPTETTTSWSNFHFLRCNGICQDDDLLFFMPYPSLIHSKADHLHNDLDL